MFVIFESESYYVLKTTYIQKLIDQGEHQQLDFKFEIADSRKIARSLVAFANTDGGKLLIGVKDNGVIAGVRSVEEYYMAEAAAQIYSRPAIEFYSKEWDLNGKKVLEIIIPKSDKKPHYAQNSGKKWLVYIRFNDQNLLANNILIKAWKRKSRKKGVYIKYSDKEKYLLEYLENHKDITLSKFCRLAHISRYRAENILINFIALDIIEILITEKQILYKVKTAIE